jgi:hypothetical protein
LRKRCSCSPTRCRTPQRKPKRGPRSKYVLPLRLACRSDLVCPNSRDEETKTVVASVLADFGWPPAVDVGGIEGSRLLEELALLWVAIEATRGSFDHGFKLLTG